MKRLFVPFAFLCLLGATGASGQDKIARSRDLAARGDARGVISILQAVLPTDIQYRESLLLLADAYLAVGRPDSAETRARDLLAFNEKNLDALILAVPALRLQKKYAEAYTMTRKGLKAFKNNAVLLTELGRIHLAVDSTEAAIVAFSQGKEADPKHVPAYIGLGEAYAKLQAGAVAILQYEEAIALDSSRCDLKHILARLYQSEQRYNEAARMYIETIRCSDDKVKPSLELGSLYHKAKQYGNATNVLAQYVTAHPEDAEVWAMFAESVDASRSYEKGLTVADSVLARRPGHAPALKLAGKTGMLVGKAQRQLELHKKAISHFESLKALQPLDGEDYKYLGKAHFELKNDTLAIRLFERSLAADSAQSDIYMDLGSAYMRQKDWARAGVMFQKKMLSDTTAVAAFVNYALCQEQLQSWENSRQALLRALRQVPNYIPGHYHLGFTLQRMDSVSAAEREYNTVISLIDTAKTRYRAEYGDAWRYIAFVGLFEKNWPKALNAIENALSVRPKDVELMLWHAQTLHAQGKREEARTAYERVLKFDPKHKEAQKGLDRLDLGF